MEHAGWNRNNKRGTKVKKEHRGQVQRPSHPLSSIFARLFAAVGSFADLTAHLTFRFVVPVPFFFSLPLSFFFHPVQRIQQGKNFVKSRPFLPIHHHCEQLWRVWRRPLSKSRFDRANSLNQYTFYLHVGSLSLDRVPAFFPIAANT